MSDEPKDEEATPEEAAPEAEAPGIVPDGPEATDTIIPAEVEAPKRVKGKTVPLEEAPAPTPAQEEEVRRPGKGETVVMYHGLADVVEVGDYRFRPGQPVIVRSDVVEELLTMPNESFVEVKE